MSAGFIVDTRRGGAILIAMKKICLFFVCCLIVLSFFTSCSEPKTEPKNITITLDSGVLEKETKKIDSIENETITLPSGDSLWTTEKYVFSGWSKTKGGEVAYKAGDRYSSSSDVTLYAVWTAKAKITYLSNGGTGDAHTEYYKKGEKITLKSSLFSREGCYLYSWNTSEDESGTTYNLSEEIVLNEDLTLYAIWKESSVVQYYSDGALVEKQSFAGNTVTLKRGDDLIKEGYEFYSWNTKENGDGISYEQGSEISVEKGLVLYAQWQFIYDDLCFTLDPTEDTYSVKAAGSTITGKVTIPGKYKGKAVTAIEENAFKDCSQITEVSIPESIETIGAGAFHGCMELTTINLPESLKEVSGSTFSGCSSLKSITLPLSLETIGSYAFYGCTGLEIITIPEKCTEISSDAFSGCSNLKVMYIEQTQNDYYYNYEPWGAENASVYWIGCYSIDDNGVLSLKNNAKVSGEVIIPETIRGITVTSIGDGAFKNKGEIPSIKLPGTVTRIGGEAFSGCYFLYSITIPEGVEYIGVSCFSGCSLSSITLPDSVKSVGNNAFSSCGPMDCITIKNPKLTAEEGSWGAGSVVKYIYGNYQIDGEGKISAVDKDAVSGDIVIPGKIGDRTVTGIGSYAFSDCRKINSVEIPEGLKNIGDNAFSGCSALVSVSLPDSLETIEEYAFKGCSNLELEVIPSGVETIGYQAFSNCDKLTEVTILGNVGASVVDAFSDCNNLKAVYIEQTKPMDASSMGYNVPVYWIGNYIVIEEGVLTTEDSSKETEKIIIPEKIRGITVKAIGDNAFSGSGITSVKLPETVTKIGNGAFSGCGMLQSIDGLDRVTAIGNNAFNSCYSLNSVDISSVTGPIGDYTFKRCTSLDSITIPDGVTSLGKSAFEDCVNLRSIEIKNGLTSIGDSCFSECPLSSITLPESVTSVGENAFYNSACDIVINNPNLKSEKSWGVYNSKYICGNYQIDSEGKISAVDKDAVSGDIVIPGKIGDRTVTAIADSAFDNCSKITSVSIPGSVVSIGTDAFSDCSALVSVSFSLPTSLKTIGVGAFGGCVSLNLEAVPNGVESIGNDAFSSCRSLTEIEIPSTAMSLGKTLFLGCGNLKVYIDQIKPSASVPNLGCEYAYWIGNYSVDDNGVLSVKNGSLEYGEVLIPDKIKGKTVEVIGAGAFQNNEKITSITLPSTVTKIGEAAFSGCSQLQHIYGMENVETLGKSAFYECKELESINISGVTGTIGENTFYNCNFSFSSITIPKSVTSIGDRAFYGCSLSSITIPSSVKSIGNEAFYGCRLSSITIPSSVISLGDSAFSGCSQLYTVELENGLTSIGASCFSGCSWLSSITLPESVKTLGASAFSGCSQLYTVELKNELTSIGASCFSGCFSLSSITLPESVTTVGSNAFGNCMNISIIINNPKLTADEGSWGAGSEVKYIYGNYQIDSEGKISAVDKNAVSGDIVIPGKIGDRTVTGIGSYAFSGCTDITSVTIPEGVTSIYEYAFSYCSTLSSFTLPSSLEHLGGSVFYNCSNLTEITYNSKMDDWKKINRDYYWLSGSSITKINCTDGTITFNPNPYY